MKKIFLASLMLVNFLANAQIVWNIDLNMARSAAMAENKFIVMDFWADWCGPCKEMDRQMWNNEKINAVSNNFIALKVNVDSNRDLAVHYKATAIPKVIIIDAAGNEVWQQVGFASASPFMAIFEQIPEATLSGDELVKEFYSKGDQSTWISLANSYQTMGRETEYTKLKQGFLNLSDEYFKKLSKKGDDESLRADAGLNLILNDAYRGKGKKALKQILKDENASSELRNFVIAYCYKCTDQEAAMKKYKALLSNPEFIAQLD